METIPAAMADAARRFGDAEALVDGPVRLSWRQLHQQIRTFAGALAADGVEQGDRVAVCAPNSHHWVIAALGALHAGATLVPVNTRYTAAETTDLLTRSNAKALVVARDFLGRDRLAELDETPPVVVEVR
jgi:acyl-CoA synthetase (AMP-forming)/AMP-acid ligase II